MRAVLVALSLCVLTGAASSALAGVPPSSTGDQSIVVVDVDGLLDPVTADLVERSLTEAEREGAALFVLTLDSSVAVDVDVADLGDRVARARVPVVSWVKGGGAARGGPARVAVEADVVALATDAVIETGGEEFDRAGGPVDLVAPTLRDLIALLDGREVVVEGEARALDLGRVIGEAGGERKQVLPISFRELGLTEQAQHALTSPFVAYLLLVLGLCLIVFEFFAVGIGLAAAAGCLLVVGAFVGFAHLPVNAVAMALLVAGVACISIDVQAGVPRFWAIVGTVLLLVGSFRLYDGPSRLDPPAWQVIVVVVGALLFVLPGLAAVIRARFSTPTIGRDWMVGERGVAEIEFDQDGVVTVRGALWRARSTRAARIHPGESVRVTGIRGLVLEVEPLDEAPGDGDRAARAG